MTYWRTTFPPATVGGRGSDTLFGTDGDDIFLSSRGSNSIEGGAGIDTVDYSAHRGPITIGTAGTILKGRGQSDIVKDVEVIIGAEGRANRIDVSSVDEESTVSINVDLSSGKLSANDIPFIGTLSYSIENFRHITGSAAFNAFLEGSVALSINKREPEQ